MIALNISKMGGGKAPWTSCVYMGMRCFSFNYSWGGTCNVGHEKSDTSEASLKVKEGGEGWST